MFSRKCVGLLLVILLATSVAFGQGVMGRIVGTVTDTTGAMVVGAKLELVDQATGLKRTGTSGPDGKFVFIALNNGLYKLTVSMQGFKSAVYPDIKVDLGRTAEVTAQLEVGQVTSEVVVEAAAEVLQTQTTAIEGGVQGRQLRGLPLANRDVLDFVLLMPGANQVGGTRYSTFDALPKGALNITMDGINVQDNSAKSSATGSYFTMIRPKQDAIEEIQVTSGNNTADNAGSGAVQIKFATRRGTNDWHGGLYEYYRDQGMNANLFFYNRALYNPTTHASCSRPATGCVWTPLRRPTNHLQQYGASGGGPLIKNKLFVFTNFEDFRLPQAAPKTSRILTTDAMTGLLHYGSGGAVTVNVLNMAAAYTGTDANGRLLPSTIDPTIKSMLDLIQTVRNVGNVKIANLSSTPWFDQVNWANTGPQRRYFNTVRIDYDATDRIRFNVVGNFNHFGSWPDALNNNDQAYPGIAQISSLAGGQNGERYSLVAALNWTLTPRLNWELRVGKTTGWVHFNDGITLGSLMPNNYAFQLNSVGNGWAGVPSLFAAPGATGVRGLPDNRAVPAAMYGNNFGYVTGKHTITFGNLVETFHFWETYYYFLPYPIINVGFNNTLDLTAANLFTAANIAAASTTPAYTPTNDEVDAARGLWADLVGRVTGVSYGRNFDEISHTYKDGVSYHDQVNAYEVGTFVQDSWRATKTLTVNYGVRFEFQSSPVNPNGSYSYPMLSGLWGISGVGNLFKPGTLGGTTPTFVQKASGFYDPLKRFLPNLGIAWSPNLDNKLWKAVFGGPGKTVFRGGYAMAATRESMYIPETYVGGTSAPTVGQATALTAGSQFLKSSSTDLNIKSGLNLSDYNNTTGSWPVPYFTFPTSYTMPMNFSTFTFQWPVNVYGVNPHIKLPYVQSWSFGLQRELSPGTVLEVRYLGNHATKLWRGMNLNETNIFENGFLDEFKLAQKNQLICLYNATACLAAQTGWSTKSNVTFANLALTDASGRNLGTQSALPILTAAYGAPGGSNSYWYSSTYTNYVKYGNAGVMGNGIAGNSALLCNMVGTNLPACGTFAGKTTAGAYPSNFWRVNPDATGASVYLLTNGADSFYNSMQIEVRRRMSKGLMIQGNYTFAKGLANTFSDSTTDTETPFTLRNIRLNRGYSAFDIRHTARIFWTWELPFGPGRHFAPGNKVLSKIAEGWEFSGIAALQSGRVFRLTNGQTGTVNGSEAGIVLNGITPNQLQKLVGLNKDYYTMPQGAPTPCADLSNLYYMQTSLIDSTCAAYHWNPTLNVSSTTSGTPTITSYTDGKLQMPTTPGVWGQFVYLHGPRFIKPDFTVAKQIKVTERINTRFEARFFNALNISNWYVGGVSSTGVSSSISSTSFGKTANYYQDVSANQDQGPRMIELVLRINF
jgi:hypothetical protein